VRKIGLALMALVVGGMASAQPPADDWGQLGKYRDANAQQIASGQKPDIVLMGDSITEGWVAKRPGVFSALRVGRGISGQTTPQMLVRFREDVIDLHPKAVQIMAGTNDIAGNTGPMSPEETEANIASMTELAQAHGIKVILASIPPAANFPWKPGLEVTDKIVAFNKWIRAYAASHHAIYADYWSALQDGRGGMKPGLSYDGVHPTEQGYDTMLPVLEAALKKSKAGR
jgi:lysophospholipase L1-like esterase